MTSTAIVAYLALFATVGFLFVLASLLLGAFLRARLPTTQKLETYECGEPAVGPGSVQFDLRFYVVALVFLIFEVEVAFFFPPATVFGKATHALAQQQAETRGATDSKRSSRNTFGFSARSLPSPPAPLPKGEGSYFWTAANKVEQHAENTEALGISSFSPRALARAAMLDLGVFFAVLLVGFAYLWRRGDLDWVRAVGHPPVSAGSGPISVQLGGGTRP